MGFGRRARHALSLLLCFALPGAGAADLTAQESRWLQGAWPVLVHARGAGLPIDVVVQPQPAAGQAPMAMAFIGGRCKFVLTLRGHEGAQATLDALEPGLRDAALELMAAHEVGHCLRHVDGHWHAAPAGVAPLASPPASLTAAQREDYRMMQATRLEEGFADMAGLAWIAQRRPAQYAPLYAWLLHERTHDTLPGSHHDTAAWLRLAQDPRVFQDAASPYARVDALWRQGMAF